MQGLQAPGKVGKKKLIGVKEDSNDIPAPKSNKRNKSPQAATQAPTAITSVYLKLCSVPENDAWVSASSEKSAEVGSCMGP